MKKNAGERVLEVSGPHPLPPVQRTSSPAHLTSIQAAVRTLPFPPSPALGGGAREPRSGVTRKKKPGRHGRGRRRPPQGGSGRGAHSLGRGDTEPLGRRDARMQLPAALSAGAVAAVAALVAALLLLRCQDAGPGAGSR